MAEELSNLEHMLERIGEAANGRDPVSLGVIIGAVGTRSFGPLLLLAGTILASPLSGIPGFPTTMGVLILLIALQLLFRRDHFWLPKWMLKRTIARSKLDTSLKWLQPPARFIDRWLRPRLTVLIKGAAVHLIALICIGIAVTLPAMEIVPFSATGAGFVLAAFGLGMIAHDGILALCAYAVTIAIYAMMVMNFF